MLCRKDGNPFNTTIIPSPPAAAPAPEAMAPSPEKLPRKAANSPSMTVKAPMPAIARRSFKAKSIVWIAGAGILIFIALGIGVCLFMLWCLKRRPRNKNNEKHDGGVYPRPLHKRTCSDFSFAATNDEEKGKSDSS